MLNFVVSILLIGKQRDLVEVKVEARYADLGSILWSSGCISGARYLMSERCVQADAGNWAGDFGQVISSP